MTCAHTWVTQTNRLQFSNSKIAIDVYSGWMATGLLFIPCCSGMGLWYATVECMCVGACGLAVAGQSGVAVWVTLTVLEIHGRKMQDCNKRYLKIAGFAFCKKRACILTLLVCKGHEVWLRSSTLVSNSAAVEHLLKKIDQSKGHSPDLHCTLLFLNLKLVIPDVSCCTTLSFRH